MPASRSTYMLATMLMHKAAVSALVVVRAPSVCMLKHATIARMTKRCLQLAKNSASSCSLNMSFVFSEKMEVARMQRLIGDAKCQRSEAELA